MRSSSTRPRRNRAEHPAGCRAVARRPRRAAAAVNGARILTPWRPRRGQYSGAADSRQGRLALGLPDAIGVVWPWTTVQLCVVHLIRASLRYARP